MGAGGLLVGFDHGINLLLLNARHQVFVRTNAMVQQQRLRIAPLQGGNIKKRFNIVGESRQNRLEI